VFSARSTPMADHATTDKATVQRCFLYGPCLDVISRTISESACSAVHGSEEFVGESVRELQFSRCVLLLLEAGS
jgi:hypothetical protein